MTPEQENELVARWMGWTCVAAHRATAEHWHPNTWGKPNCQTHYGSPPPYCTDPALLWELMERLIMAHWVFDTATKGRFYAEPIGSGSPVTCDTLAEAVFAAAVMQAEQEQPA